MSLTERVTSGELAGGELVSEMELALRLASQLGDGEVLGPGEASLPYTIAGQPPLAVVFPRSSEEMSAVVALAREARLPLVPWGGGTQQEVGPPLIRPGIVVSLERMRAVVDLDIGNMTAEVQAGLPNKHLQDALAPERLWFPVDPPDWERSTVGGNLATNASGPSRLRYRGLRDHLMGLSVVLSSGEVARFGGKTVKNVAGYDLRKLMIGSWGTLGIITTAIVRLWPLPEAKVTLAARLPGEEAFADFSKRLLASYLLPTSFERLDVRAGADLADYLGWTVSPTDLICLVGIDGFQSAVERQTREATQMLLDAGAATVETLEAEREASAWERWRQVEATVGRGAAGLVVGRASIPLSRVGEFGVLLRALGAQCDLAVASNAHAGNGVVSVYALLEDESERTLASVAGLAAGLRRGAERLGGFFLVEKAPAPLRKETTIWPQRSDYSLMRAVKARLDPDGLLNPGRGVDGACDHA